MKTMVTPKAVRKMSILVVMIVGLAFVANTKQFSPTVSAGTQSRTQSCDDILDDRWNCIINAPSGGDAAIACLENHDMKDCQFDYDYCTGAQSAASQCDSIPQDTIDGIRAWRSCRQTSRIDECQ